MDVGTGLVQLKELTMAAVTLLVEQLELKTAGQIGWVQLWEYQRVAVTMLADWLEQRRAGLTQ